MNEFKSFDIKAPVNGMTGDKISIDRILNKEIIVEKYETKPSKYGEGKDCLYLQIQLNSEQRVVFVGSATLMQMIKQVPTDKFPFKTTIVKQDKRLEFI